ncbi:DUF1822 family protein [Candidatus Woesearchaeota archaeon]|nr:DUF1822 family protein [Candidatus Woesearchaeota archaeon]
MKIKILNQYVEDAKNHAFVRLNYYPSKTETKEKFNQIIKGKIGEEVVKAALRMEGIPYEVDITHLGEPDKFDIKVRNITLEVKTISNDTKYRALIINKNSFDQGKQLDYYILVKIDKDWNIAEIIGYATKKDFLQKPVVKDLKTRMVYSIPLKNLRKFEELLDVLKKQSL